MGWIRKWLNPKLVIAVVFVLILVVYFATRKEEESFASKYEGCDLTAQAQDIGRENTYAKYLVRHSDAARPQTGLDIDLLSYSAKESTGVTKTEEYEGIKDVLITDEDSTLSYEVNVKEAGLYNIQIEYYPIQARGIDIERSVELNGEVPFLGAEAITFSRVWGDEGEIKQDNQGNDIRPTQVECPRWQTATFDDYMGYQTQPFQFYFEQGNNKLALIGVNEPMAIRSIQLIPVKETPDYKDYLDSYDLSTYTNTEDQFLEKIQGEEAVYRSSPSLYATCDRSSGITEPYSVSGTKINMTGGQAWRIAGQWIEWEITVPENGMYALSFKARQNYNRGFVSNRTLRIDGVIPCSEVSAVPFRYNNEWKLVTLSDTNGEALYFPLTKGTHTIQLEVTLGDLGTILTQMEESIYQLNEIYRRVLILTGAEPDKYRDYQIDKIYPDIITSMDVESRILYKMVDDLTAYAGERGSQAATIQTLAKQLEKFVKNPDKIAKTMKNFKDNISSLGNSLTALAQGQLDIDYLLVSAKQAKLPKVDETFLTSAGHEAKTFVNSFVQDYSSLGDVYEGEEAIDVWIQAGRDQSTILKTMIDDTFTPQTGINVNVKLISAESLMPAVVAGTGPDVALTVANGDPVNYALRNASLDLTQFDDLDEVLTEFYDSSIVPYRYNGGVYGLPETQFFNVMFYRKDIFEQLGIEIPQTWDDLIKIFPVIQKNNMNIGIPSVERKINNILYPDLSNFFAQLYQRGGALYNEKGSKALLDGEEAVEAFEAYTRFFTHYKTPTVYDFINRFRTGEMPVGFVDYNNYNTLVVSAPEIRGLWDIALLPGTEMEDGTINRATSAWGNASMILANTDNKEASWEFMKWWMKSDTQVRFGRELEAVMGSSARYATANKVAFEQLSWSAADIEVLKGQWEWIIGTPEVAGGYYTSRHIVNAVRKVINKSEDARETLLDYTRMINEELNKKRKEFGLEIE